MKKKNSQGNATALLSDKYKSIQVCKYAGEVVLE